MKQIYSVPDFEIKRIVISYDILLVSTSTQTGENPVPDVGGGSGGSGSDPIVIDDPLFP